MSFTVVEILKPQGFKEHEVRPISGQKDKESAFGRFFFLLTVDKRGSGKSIFPVWGDRFADRREDKRAEALLGAKRLHIGPNVKKL